jgi:hypothetical protein
VSPILALRAAILAALSGDPALAGLMGSPTIHDEPPRGAEPVYALFGEASARDDSTPDTRAHAQDLALLVHGRPGSARPALEAAERMAVLLDDADLPLQGHRLVGLRVLAVEAGRDERTGLARVVLRLRAVTEAA